MRGQVAPQQGFVGGDVEQKGECFHVEARLQHLQSELVFEKPLRGVQPTKERTEENTSDLESNQGIFFYSNVNRSRH